MYTVLYLMVICYLHFPHPSPNPIPIVCVRVRARTFPLKLFHQDEITGFIMGLLVQSTLLFLLLLILSTRILPRRILLKSSFKHNFDMCIMTFLKGYAGNDAVRRLS